MELTSKRRRLIALCFAGLLGLTAVIMAESNQATVEASSGYVGVRDQFDNQVREAGADGFTRDDLNPVLTREEVIASQPVPVWIGDRPAFYHQQTLSLQSLVVQLRATEATVLQQAKTSDEQGVQSVKAAIARDQQVGVDPADLGPIQTGLDGIVKAEPDAKTLTQYRELAIQANALAARATDLSAAQEAENTALNKAAGDLKAKQGANLEAIRKLGQSMLATTRNEATSAAFLDAEGAFTGIAALNKAYRLMEQHSGQLGSGEVDQVSIGAAAATRYGGQVHDLFMKGITQKTIIVSLAAQELWAYEPGKTSTVLDTIVTTGRPALPTDVGPMKVLWKVSPWKMVSPWPQGSPFYYPPTDVRKVLWFTSSGEGLHDAPWRSWFGPGSNIGDGTHGCINLPGNTVDFVFDWAPVGTPVIVIPGDGSSQANQIKQDSIDDPSQAGAVKGA